MSETNPLTSQASGPIAPFMTTSNPLRHERSYILIIDNDKAIRETIRVVIEDMGYNAACAKDDAEAYSIIHRLGPPKLVLLDFCFDQVAGEKFIKHLKTFDPPPAAILLTAMNKPELIHKRLETDMMIVKPFTLEELMDTVERFS